MCLGVFCQRLHVANPLGTLVLWYTVSGTLEHGTLSLVYWYIGTLFSGTLVDWYTVSGTMLHWYTFSGTGKREQGKRYTGKGQSTTE